MTRGPGEGPPPAGQAEFIAGKHISGLLRQCLLGLLAMLLCCLPLAIFAPASHLPQPILPIVYALSAAGIWLVALGLVLATFVFSLRRRPARHALRIATSLRPPQGPLMWCGLLIAHAVVAFLRAGVLA